MGLAHADSLELEISKNLFFSCLFIFLCEMRQACKTIANLVDRATITGMVGYEGGGGSINVQVGQRLSRTKFFCSTQVEQMRGFFQHSEGGDRRTLHALADKLVPHSF
jgi:hypothetical protein